MESCLIFRLLGNALLVLVLLVTTANCDVLDVLDGGLQGTSFQHLVTDVTTGKVYVGGTNRLFQLTSDLRVEQSVTTGPRDDNPMCPPPTSECQCFGPSCIEFEKVPVDAVSKALVLDRRGQRLISCTNLYQGHCDLHLLTNISVTDLPLWAMLVPNDLTSSVVMFVAPGPPNPASTDVLYVGATRSTLGLPAYKDIVPAVCMRNLHDLDLVSDDILTPSRIDVEVQQRDVFRVDFIHGFGSLGFSYFLTVQKVSAVTDSERMVTHISRVCQNDKSLYSYTELPIDCRHSGRTFDVLTAAAVVHPGPRLADSLGLVHGSPPTDMEHVLVAVFSASHVRTPGGGGSSAGGPAAAALCVYPLRDIRSQFTETIQRCFQGHGSTGPDHYVQPKSCYTTPFEIGDDYCGQYDINHPIVGAETVSRDALVVWNNVTVTSLAVTTTTAFTVAFVGTHDGHVRKVVLESAVRAVEFDSVAIHPGDVIKRDMAFDKTEDHLYVMTSQRVVRMSVANCSQFTSCEQCLSAKDPYCGWCSGHRKCSRAADCSTGIESADSSPWLPYNKGLQCTRIVKLSALHAHRHARPPTVVVLTVQNLPTSPPVSFPGSGSGYECLFSGHGVALQSAVTRVDRIDMSNTTLRCEVPAHSLLPAFPVGSDHIHMLLSLTVSNQPIVTTNFTFFDCTLHSTCTQCTSSRYPCTWCIQNHRCTHNREECHSDLLITGKHVHGKTDTPGPEFCPRIENVAAVNSSEILVASSSEISIRVKARRLQNFQKSVTCVFTVNDGVERPAHLVLADSGTAFVDCQPVLFQYAGITKPFVEIPLSIAWQTTSDQTRKLTLDNPQNIHVTVYKCSAMALSCGRCRSVDIKYNCGWCPSTRTCSIQSQCPASWLHRQQTCPDPAITQIHPMSGPLDGNTLLTVVGFNLGITSEDTRVSIADIECSSVRYIEPTTQFVCVTGKSAAVLSSSISVSIDNKFTAISSHSFSYVQSVLIDFFPHHGVQSGGTQLTLVGRHLDSGVAAAVRLNAVSAGGDAVLFTQCVFTETRQPNVSVCVTLPSETTFVATDIELTIDGNVVPHSVPPHGFHVVPDPAIHSVSPGKTIVSGGIRITVTGIRLDVIVKPLLVIYLSDTLNVSQPCDILSSVKMVCTSGSLRHFLATPSHLVPTADKPLRVSYGFVMDDTVSVRNMSAVLPPDEQRSSNHGSASLPGRQTRQVVDQTYRRRFTRVAGDDGNVGAPTYLLVYPDPELDSFDGVKQFYYTKNEYLTINGRNLKLVLKLADIKVVIGDIECNVTSASNTQLTCLPNMTAELQPAVSTVRVYLGSELVYVVGELEFGGSVSAMLLDRSVIAMIAAGAAGLLFTVIIIVCVAYSRKSRQSARAMKRLRNQMDVLEARVAKECKEAFAELQTDMTEVTNDILGASGLPFHDYSSFCLRVLFPSETRSPFAKLDHCNGDMKPVSNGNCSLPVDTSGGLRLFQQLLNNKIFVLTFVRTLEQQKDFVIMKKVYFASLLSIVLHSRMDYYTDVLKTLLAELIDKAVQGRCPPKLLLRRTECVAEKLLTNWFTFLLYKFLKESAGEPLFLLYRAIKQQVEKGPVDALTGEAKYSLSEDKLIRQQLDYQVISLNVIDVEYSRQHRTQYHGVRVLDCDTISQVKDKILDAIYRNAAYSNRPSSGELDLEWQTGVSMPLILNDIDGTSKLISCGNDVRSEARCVNTLRHYGLRDGAVVALVSKQTTLSSTTSSYYSNSINSNTGQPRLLRDVQLKSTGSSSALHKHLNSIGVSLTDDCYHLVRSHDAELHHGDRGSKMVSEIYLTRLLATKGTLQQYIDDLFETIFSTASRGSVLPSAIKYLFDFLDDQALNHGIVDAEVVHTWKSNSLPLRFWVNVIKNPDFVFDIHKSNIVDSCLSVVAQTFMDSCSMSEQKLSKDSPSSKLLYAKDIPKYKSWVERYYEDIQKMPAINEIDMCSMLKDESRSHCGEFETKCAVQELYKLSQVYNDDLMRALEEDEFAVEHRLAFRLSQVHSAMNSVV